MSRPGDLKRDGVLTVADIDAMGAVAINNPRDPVFDLNDDGVASTADREVWVKELKHAWFGDANLDGEFNSSALATVFAAGEYEDAMEDNSGWDEGDWNADGDFTSSDLVVAIADGGYEQGARPAAVPEPSTILLLLSGSLAMMIRRDEM